MNPKILVTGGAGYIGSHTVVELLKEGFSPIIVDDFSNSSPLILEQLKIITNQEIPFYNLDCNSLAIEEVFKKERNIEGVIHFAADKAVGESVVNPLKYYKNNVGSLINIVGFMQKYGVNNLVFSSSCTVYGEPKTLPVTEEFPIQKASSPYGNTKQVCEEILTDVVNSGAEINVALLRYFNPIGAHESGLIGELPNGVPNNLIPFITQTAIGKRDELTVFGDDYSTADGSCIRDYIHVVDLSKAHIKALNLNGTLIKKGAIDVFNIGTGLGVSVLELIDFFNEVSGMELKYKIGERRDGDIEKIYAEATKAEKILNWKSELTIKQALKDAWRWQQNLEKYEQQF